MYIYIYIYIHIEREMYTCIHITMFICIRWTRAVYMYTFRQTT